MRDLVNEYREIQLSAESGANLDRAVNLAMRIAAGRGRTNGTRWTTVLDVRKEIPLSAAKLSSGVRRVRDVTLALTAIAQKVDSLQHGIPDDQYSLLMDTLLLVFQQAYFVLLPEVRGERRALLQTFRNFSGTLARSADRFQVLGLVELEEKHFEQAVEAFRAAVAATHTDAHDFITRVQLLWTVLMEQDRSQDALEVLLDVYPRASRSDLDEITSLLRTTFLDSRTESLTSRRQSRTRKGA